jgi:hypothetical protein
MFVRGQPKLAIEAYLCQPHQDITNRKVQRYVTKPRHQPKETSSTQIETSQKICDF